MRIKIIGENHCARATRHLLRLAGFAVTDYLPAHALTRGPNAGYAITIDLAPAHTPNSHLWPDLATQEDASVSEEADRSIRDASLPAFVHPNSGRTTAGEPSSRGETSSDAATDASAGQGNSSGATAGSHSSFIHFDSVESALEAAVLRHVTLLAAGAVILDRPGGVVHSERELRIVAPQTGDARADEAAAVAIEFGVLRGMLDLFSPGAHVKSRGAFDGKKLLHGDAEGDADGGTDVGGAGEGAENIPSGRGRNRKKWWPFAVVVMALGLGILRGTRAAGPGRVVAGSCGADYHAVCSDRLQAGIAGSGICPPEGGRYTDGAGAGSVALHGVVAGGGATETRRLKPAPLKRVADTRALLGVATRGMVTESDRLKPVLLKAGAAFAAQGQFVTGQGGIKITDGNNFFVVDPCKAETKLYASINQTGSTQLVAGTTSKKIYVCSIHVVAAAATNVAVVEGTGAVCATGTAGVSGFGGATAATGWNFAGNGGISLGNGDSSVGAEGTSGDNLCIFNSGSGQVSGGISYVVE